MSAPPNQNVTDIWSHQIEPSPDALCQILGGEAVLLNIQTERYFALDAVGARIWEVLSETHRVDRVVEQLLAEYEVEEAQLREDTGRLIDALINAKLLTVGTALAR